MQYLFYSLICLLATTLGAISGIGGGVILIPVLTIFLSFDQKVAQGITLLYFIPTAIFALTVHIKNKNVDFKVAFKVASTGVISAGVGAYCVRYFSTPVLGKIFAVFLLSVGTYQVVCGIKELKKI